MLGKLKKKAYGISSGCHSKIQLTLEQSGLELHGSTYVWNFFFPWIHTAVLMIHSWLNLRMQRSYLCRGPDYKVICGFSTVQVVSAPDLGFKGQLYHRLDVLNSRNFFSPISVGCAIQDPGCQPVSLLGKAAFLMSAHEPWTLFLQEHQPYWIRALPSWTHLISITSWRLCLYSVTSGLKVSTWVLEGTQFSPWQSLVGSGNHKWSSFSLYISTFCRLSAVEDVWVKLGSTSRFHLYELPRVVKRTGAARWNGDCQGIGGGERES